MHAGLPNLADADQNRGEALTDSHKPTVLEARGGHDTLKRVWVGLLLCLQPLPKRITEDILA